MLSAIPFLMCVIKISTLKTKRIEWSREKNEALKQNRNVCFEDIESAIDDDRVLDIIPHHNPEKYPNQKILIVQIRDYIHYVPFIEDDDMYFLKKHHSQSKTK